MNVTEGKTGFKSATGFPCEGPERNAELDWRQSPIPWISTDSWVDMNSPVRAV